VSQQSVVVVGAGTVGLVTALGLAQNGFDVTVLERETATPTGPRDTAYHWCILPTFAKLGVLDAMISQGLACTELSMKVLRTGELIQLSMDPLSDVAAYPFNLHLPQNVLVEVMSAALTECPNVRVERGVAVTAVSQDQTGATVTALDGTESRTYRAGWVIGADGSRSVVRRSLGMSFAGTTWPERLVSTDLRFDFSTLGHSSASALLDPKLGAIVAQVDRTGLWRYTIAESRMLDEDGIEARTLDAISQALPSGADPDIVVATPYRAHQRSADAFRRGRVLLVGDAAHITVPTLAFGMLSGLYDAKSLIEALSAVALDGHDEEILDDYSAKRRHNFWDVVSPRSSERMELLFRGGDTAQLDRRLVSLRRMAADRSATRRFFEEDRDCETPSLLHPSDDALVLHERL